MKKFKLLAIIFLLVNSTAFAQVYSDKVVGKKNASKIDSLKTAEYPYSLPIWGKKVTQMGYHLPYSAGISVNYFWQKSDIVIDNLYVGFNNGPQYNLDQIVRFNSAVASASSISIRPDVWVFPFLNVYGILGKVASSTDISAGIWVPDESNNWSEIYNFSTKADFSGTTFGIGMTPTIGVGGGWLALDINFAWSDLDGLTEPAQSFVFGPRMGKTFNFKKPDSSINVWVGAFRVDLNSETSGSLALSDLISGSDAQAKVDAGLVKVEEKQVAVDAWWNGLTPTQQANPVNAARYNTANNALETAGNFLTGIDGALSTLESSTVQYSLDKAPKDMWNFLVGSQYQYNKHFMIRAELGFLGTRTQFITGLQYRFGL
ncbi:hypothetical protein ACSVH2_13710 [Flavobacterium sp. RSB2_4_14]|uniref:hypothetical protein n=1 Tax=Flavobacterium sp. RSB2_4_14 TaxID=3447665 RepID=UPI003F409111